MIKKYKIIVLQISITTKKIFWASGPVISSIEFHLSSKRSLKYGENGGLATFHISVPGQKLAFITGTKGIAIDSLAFYYI